MNREIRSVYKPETVTHPGAVVTDYLEFNSWSQRDLARRTGITPKTISEICSEKAPISPSTAIAFEKVFKRPAHFWLNLQRKFDECEARSRVAELFEDWRGWAAKFPIAEMCKLQLIENIQPKEATVDALLEFFGVSSPNSWNSVWKATNVAYRQTHNLHTSEEAISAWVRATELWASDLERDVGVNEFDRSRILDSIDELRYQTRKGPEEFVPNVQSLCAQAGILVVWVPELSKTGISGCARWLSEKKAMIALTLRHKKDDQMWFTFFHELGHILLHRRESKFVLDNAADDLGDLVVDSSMRKREEEANQFAANTLIPPDHLLSFVLNNDFSNEAIHDFSEKQGLGPGIIVGRLQHEGILKYTQGNTLKQTFNWEVRE